MTDDSTAEYYCFATYLPLRHYWDVVPFLIGAARVNKQVSQAEGNIAWNARGNPLTKKFWTNTIWRDRASVSAFVKTAPHADVVLRMAAWSAPDAAFAEWTSSSDQLDWAEAMRRLQNPSFYYKKPQ